MALFAADGIFHSYLRGYPIFCGGNPSSGRLSLAPRVRQKVYIRFAAFVFMGAKRPKRYNSSGRPP